VCVWRARAPRCRLAVRTQRPRPLPAAAPPAAPRRAAGDLPSTLQNTSGGFLANDTAFQDAFVYYADTLFKELGPLVKLWMT
jgi:hypothetical protein